MELNFRNLNNTLIAADQDCANFLCKAENQGEIRLRPVNVKTGSQSMLNTWWMIVTEVSQWMAWQGAKMPLYVDKNGNWVGERRFTKDDGHEAFTVLFLGTDEQGRRKTWKRSSTTDEVVASIGDRVWAIDQLIQLAVEKGITIRIPEKSEYRKLKARQVA